MITVHKGLLDCIAQVTERLSYLLLTQAHTVRVPWINLGYSRLFSFWLANNNSDVLKHATQNAQMCWPFPESVSFTTFTQQKRGHGGLIEVMGYANSFVIASSVDCTFCTVSYYPTIRAHVAHPHLQERDKNYWRDDTAYPSSWWINRFVRIQCQSSL